MAAYNAENDGAKCADAASVRTQARGRKKPSRTRGQALCALHKLLQALEEKPQLLLGRLISKRGGHIPQR